MTGKPTEKHVEGDSAAPRTWRCFHCDAFFTDAQSARLHFGTTEMQRPACTIDVAQYREMEEVHRRHCEEDTDLHRQIYRLESQHQMALRRAEEKGYASGLADANASRAFLTELVAAKWGVADLSGLTARSGLEPGVGPRLADAYCRALAHLLGELVAPREELPGQPE